MEREQRPRLGVPALVDITEALRADELKPAWRALTLMGVLICASPVCFAIFCAIIATTEGAPFGDPESFKVVLPTLRYTLAAVGVITIAASVAVGAVVWRASLRHQAAERTGPSASLLPIVQTYMRSTMIAMAMAEAPAIFGLVLFVMSGEWTWPAVFWFVSFAVNAARFPTVPKLAIRLEVVLRELDERAARVDR